MVSLASYESYDLCQTACNDAAGICYGSAGFVFGAITAGVGAPAAFDACNTIWCTCMSTCDRWFMGPDVMHGGSRLLCSNVDGEVEPKTGVEVGSEGASATFVKGAF